MMEQSIFECSLYGALICFSYVIVAMPLSYIPSMTVRFMKIQRFEWLGMIFALLMLHLVKISIIWDLK